MEKGILNKTLPIIFLSVCFTNCWEKQDHDILLPNIPNYTLSGYTVDMDDTTQILPNTPIHISAKAILYDTTFTPVYTTSDSNGYYQIDTVFPGIYVISAERGGYTIVIKQFDMYHEDQTYNLELPKPLISDMHYSHIQTRRLTWGHNGFWFFGTRQISPDPPQFIPVIFHIKIENGVLFSDQWYDNPFPYASCFTYASGFYYLQFHDSLAVLPSVDLSFVSYIELDDPLYGLEWDSEGFWSTYEHSIQYRGNSPSTVEKTWVVDTNFLGPLTKKGNYFWSFDLERNLLLKISPDGKIFASYRPQIGEVMDMDFGEGGKLWISSKSGLYVFDITQVERFR